MKTLRSWRDINEGKTPVTEVTEEKHDAGRNMVKSLYDTA